MALSRGHKRANSNVDWKAKTRQTLHALRGKNILFFMGEFDIITSG